MERECQKYFEYEEGLSIVWDLQEDGVNIVYFEDNENPVTEDDIMIKTTNYRQAQKVWEKTKEAVE